MSNFDNYEPLGPPQTAVIAANTVAPTDPNDPEIVALTHVQPEPPANIFNPLAPVDDEELARQMAKYQADIKAELDSPNKTVLGGAFDGTSNVTNIIEYTRTVFRRNLPSAVAQIVWLATNSDSDSIRLRASQTIMKEALKDANEQGDPIKELLAQLTKAGASPATKAFATK